MKGSDYKVGAQLKLLGTGDNGSGKSIQLCSWAKEGRLRHYDLDGRFASVANHYRNRGDEGIKILDNINTDRFDNQPALVKELRSLRDGHCPYKALFVDGLTPLGRNALNASIESRVSNYTDEIKKKNEYMMKGGVWVPQIEDFGGESQAISEVLGILYSEKFEQRGIHVFLSAHRVQMDHRDRSGKITHTTMRLLTGGKTIAAEIPNFFNEIWLFEGGTGDKGPYYEVWCKDPDENHFAKTSMNLPVKIVHTNKVLYDEVKKYIDDPTLAQKEFDARGGWSS